MIGAQIVSNLATYGHDDGHDEVGKCRNYAHLDEREKLYFYVTGLMPLGIDYSHWNKAGKQML